MNIFTQSSQKEEEFPFTKVPDITKKQKQSNNLFNIFGQEEETVVKPSPSIFERMSSSIQ
jgi:hypothetical protein